MITTHRYTLEPYRGINTRYHCPSCHSRDKTFSRYIDTETGEHIHPSVGRCNRESNCGYHYTPKQYFQENKILFDTSQLKVNKPRPGTPEPKPASLIPVEVFKASLKEHETNHFVNFIIDRFGVEVASEVVGRYYIGTSKHWPGAAVFWQIDIEGKIRAGKIMLYSPATGKRVKEPYNHITWAHKALKLPDFELKQCLFGEHLLKIPENCFKPVAIVESEKTAVISSIYLPQFIWLAAGSKDGLNIEKCSILKGRNIVLFPDLNAFEKWNILAKEHSSPLMGINFTVSDLLERKATETERKKGLDLADYLLSVDYWDFLKSEHDKNEIASNFQTIKYKKTIKAENQICTKVVQSSVFDTWEHDLTNLENFFNNVALPAHPFRLNKHTTILNISWFIESHLTVAKSNNGNPTFLPYLDRLHELKTKLIAIL